MPRTPAGETRESVYRFVRERLLAGQPPTLREIQDAFGFRAVETAREHLQALVSAGRLVQEPGRARGYRLPVEDRPPPTQLVPLLGRVQAGALTTAVEELEAWVPVQSRDAEALFALRVRGESMLGAGILPGDIVIVRKDAPVANGDIVVALVDDEATVKRYRRGTAGRVELHPENAAFEVIVRRATEVLLLGKVIEVRRHLETPVVWAAT